MQSIAIALVLISALAFLIALMALIYPLPWVFTSRKRAAKGLATAFGLFVLGTAIGVSTDPNNDKGQQQAKIDTAAPSEPKKEPEEDTRQAALNRLSGMTGDQLDISEAEIPDCREFSRHVSIETLSWDETQTVCTAYKKGFGSDPQVRVLRRMSKVVTLLSLDNYESGTHTDVADSIMQIMRDRGQHDPEAQMRTADLIWKMESGWDGAVSLGDLHDLLSNAGEMAHTLSDDGLAHMAAVLKEQKAGAIDN